MTLPPARRRPAWLDWLDATDPGLMRLRMAADVTIAIGFVLVAEWLFVRGTGALQVAVPPKTPAAMAEKLWMLNHALMVIAMMLGAILAMMGGFGVGMFGTARSQLLFISFLPLPMLALLAVGLTVHVRVISLALLAVVLAIGTYCRRFGPLGFIGGMLAFMGAFLGFFIQDYVTLGQFGWLTAEVLIGAAGAMVVHFTLFRPRPGTALRRMQRSYAARAREVASEVAELFEVAAHSHNRQAEKRLHRQLLRLNEAALLIDAQLDNPGALAPGWSAATLHQRLFDAEVGLSNIARFAITLARRPLPTEVTALVRAALADIRDADLDGVLASVAALDDPDTGISQEDRLLLQRFTMSVTDFTAALRAFRLYPNGAPPDDAASFQSQVATFGGWLPGSAFIAGTASQERGGTGLIERIRLAPYARIAIQMGVAVGGAIIAGDAMSGRRFYWAVIAAFITFMGANTAGEQLRKGFLRVVGTLVGVVAGSLLAHAVGDRVWLQIVVILVSLFLGLYLFRINYAFMTIGITVLVSQLYLELGEFSNNLLLLRLGETAVGAAIAMLTVLLVLPLHIGRVARVAARQQLEALADLVDRCLDRLADPASTAGSDLELRAAARRADMAHQALAATVWPMRTPLFGRFASQVAGFIATTTALRHYTRNLLLDTSTRFADLDARGIESLAAARAQLDSSIAAITTALAPEDGDRTPGQYVRSASLFGRVADTLPAQQALCRPQLALRDLQLVDGAFAEAARWADVPVTDLDTVTR
ncbi:MAG: FUSC family protein [Streptosporangiaceae bacterium]